MKRLLPLILFFASFSVLAQSSQLSGQVLDASDNSPIPGVNVVIKNTTKGTITDTNGRFIIDVQAPATLVFTFIGFKNTEVEYQGQTSLQVTLEEDIEELSEVVVVGYQSVERRDIT